MKEMNERQGATKQEKAISDATNGVVNFYKGAATAIEKEMNQN